MDPTNQEKVINRFENEAVTCHLIGRSQLNTEVRIHFHLRFFFAKKYTKILPEFYFFVTNSQFMFMDSKFAVCGMRIVQSQLQVCNATNKSLATINDII